MTIHWPWSHTTHRGRNRPTTLEQNITEYSRTPADWSKRNRVSTWTQPESGMVHHRKSEIQLVFLLQKNQLRLFASHYQFRKKKMKEEKLKNWECQRGWHPPDRLLFYYYYFTSSLIVRWIHYVEFIMSTTKTVLSQTSFILHEACITPITDMTRRTSLTQIRA